MPLPSRQEREAALFALAIEKPAEERHDFLRSVCGADVDLRERLESLIAAHEQSKSLADTHLESSLPEACDTPDEAVGQILGPYKLLEKIGEGGCGVVYVAEQAEPVRRRVALKVIKLGMDTRAVVARFEAERQALAMMDHPNIAKVLDAGTTNIGRPYFVMELVRGIKITDYCDQERLGTKDRLDLFVRVCQAIQHAHQKGIIHRDIKPSNILVTLHDGVPVPKVIDFGIAKATEGRLTDATVYTQLHQFIGTPAYMSPEQAEMSGLDIDTRSDIYSLGVLLYELLTGRTPFDGKELMAMGLDAMRKTIREKEPMRPSTKLSQTAGLVEKPPGKSETEEERRASLRRQLQLKETIALLRGDLDWIVMRCLEKDRTRRYETANGLVMDIKRHLDHEPVVARPPSTLYRFQKAFRRNKLVFAAGTAVTLALIVGLIVSVWQFAGKVRALRVATQAQEEQSRERQRAETEAARATSAEASERDQRKRAEQLGVENLTRLAFLRVANGNRLAEAGDTLSALAWFLAAAELEKNRPDRMDVHRRRIEVLLQRSPQLLQLWDEPDDLDLSPDGSLCATVGSTTNGTWHAVDELRVWDLARGELKFPARRLVGDVTGIEFVSGGRELIVAANDQVQLLDANTGLQTSPNIPHIMSRISLGLNRSPHFHLDSRRMVVISQSETRPGTGFPQEELQIRDSRTGVPIGAAIPLAGRLLTWGIPASTNEFTVVEINDSTSELIVTHHSWEDGRPIGSPRRHSMDRLATTDGNYAVIQALPPESDRAFRIEDLSTGRPIGELRHLGMIYEPIFSPDGRRLMTPSFDGTARLWDLKTCMELTPPLRHAHGVWRGGFSGDGERVITASFDSSARIWNSKSGDPVTPYLTHCGAVTYVQLSSNGKRAVTFCAPLLAYAWDLNRLELDGIELKHEGGVSRVRFRPGGNQVATTGADGHLRLWEPETGTLLRDIKAHAGRINELRFSEDGQLIATGGGDGKARIWEGDTGRELTVPLDHRAPVQQARFSRDGQRLLTVSGRLADEEDPNSPVGTPPHNLGGADGSWTIHVWDLSKRSLFAEISLPTIVRDAVLSPDGNRVCAVGVDGMVRFWNTIDGTPRGTTANLNNQTMSVGFSPDGKRLAVAVNSFALEPLEARVLDSESHEEVLPPLAHTDGVLVVAYSPDGSRIATAGEDHGRIWDAFTGQPLSPPLRHRGQVLDLSFAKDGRMLGMVSTDGTARVWDASTGEPITPPLSTGIPLWQVEVSPDNRFVAATGWAGSARIWNLGRTSQSLDQVLRRARLLAGRQLDSTGTELEPVSREEFVEIWENLRGKPIARTTPQLAHEIQNQPVDQLANEGGEVSFKVEVESGTPARFQWQKDGTDLPGANSSVLQLHRVSTRDAGSYRVRITGDDPESLPVFSRSVSLALRRGATVFGALKRERYDSLGGTLLDNLTNSAAFPNQPSAVNWTGLFESAADEDHSYGLRLSGFITPSTSAEYQFYIVSDDEGALFLSSSESRDERRLIAHERTWRMPRGWNVSSTFRRRESISSPIRLEQGRRYYIEALMKQASGGAHLSVAWRRKGEPPPRDGDEPISGVVLSYDEKPSPQTSTP